MADVNESQKLFAMRGLTGKCFSGERRKHFESVDTDFNDVISWLQSKIATFSEDLFSGSPPQSVDSAVTQLIQCLRSSDTHLFSLLNSYTGLKHEVTAIQSHIETLQPPYFTTPEDRNVQLAWLSKTRLVVIVAPDEGHSFMAVGPREELPLGDKDWQKELLRSVKFCEGLSGFTSALSMQTQSH